MEFKDLFKKYGPPSGGLEGLRIKLEKREKRKEIRAYFLKPSFWAFTGMTTALAFILIFLVESEEVIFYWISSLPSEEDQEVQSDQSN